MPKVVLSEDLKVTHVGHRELVARVIDPEVTPLQIALFLLKERENNPEYQKCNEIKVWKADREYKYTIGSDGYMAPYRWNRKDTDKWYHANGDVKTHAEIAKERMELSKKQMEEAEENRRIEREESVRRFNLLRSEIASTTDVEILRDLVLKMLDNAQDTSITPTIMQFYEERGLFEEVAN